MDEATSKFLKPLMDYLEVSNNESDRGKVLVAMSQIDGMLEKILLAFLLDGKATNDLFKGPNAPMRSLFNKANFSLSLSLISTVEFSAIGIMRKIRNSFAHSVSATFDDPKIEKLALTLDFGIAGIIAVDEEIAADARTRFSMSSVSLINSLYNRAHYVSKNKIRETDWHENNP